MPKISVLPTAGALTGAELVALVQNSTTVKALLSTISAYVLSQPIFPTGAAGGDLSGTYPNPTVAKIRGTGIATTAPTNSQVLTYNSGTGNWEPQTPASGGVSSIADATNGGLNFSAATGAVTANISPGNLLTKSSPTTSDLILIGDAAASNAAKTSTLAQIVTAIQTSGTWTPVFTFATPGNLVVAYSTQFGSYLQIGKWTVVTYTVATSTFTHSTASGNFQITGLPFTANNTANKNWFAAVNFQGVTKANYTQMVATILPNTTNIIVAAGGSAQTALFLTPADIPTGGSVIMQGTIMYEAA